jgi:hypothetical protein
MTDRLLQDEVQTHDSKGLSDRALIEAAARAAGLRFSKEFQDRRAEHGIISLWLLPEDGSLGSTAWNPLTDDGDALRLAVKLGLDLCVSPNTALCAWSEVTSDWMEEPPGNDPCAAMRRAIVRAASAMHPEGGM